jgi:hypothetical protein
MNRDQFVTDGDSLPAFVEEVEKGEAILSP